MLIDLPKKKRQSDQAKVLISKITSPYKQVETKRPLAILSFRVLMQMVKIRAFAKRETLNPALNTLNPGCKKMN